MKGYCPELIVKNHKLKELFRIVVSYRVIKILLFYKIFHKKAG